jgi:Flp pilus assembly secretin CpaC
MPKTGQVEAAAARRQKALDLRIAGVRYRQIGAQLGVSYQTAYRDVQTALGELATLQAGKAERLRELEVERCDKLQMALWPKARSGDEKVVRALIAVMDRRAKLLGLDAPTKLEHGGADGQPLVFTLNIAKPTHEE